MSPSRRKPGYLHTLPKEAEVFALSLNRFEVEGYMKVRQHMKTPAPVPPSDEDQNGYKKVRRMIGFIPNGAQGTGEEVQVNLVGMMSSDLPRMLLFGIEHLHTDEGKCLSRQRGPRCGSLSPNPTLAEIREGLAMVDRKEGYQETLIRMGIKKPS